MPGKKGEWRRSGPSIHRGRGGHYQKEVHSKTGATRMVEFIPGKRLAL